MPSCRNCKHYHVHREEESWEMPHIFWYEYSCSARPTIANLVQFPFKVTQCKQFEERSNTGGKEKIGTLRMP